MTDLVKRLRDAYPATQDMQHTLLGDLMDEAADTIEALQAKNARLREALEKVSNLMPDDYSPHSVEGMTGRIARAALTTQEKPMTDTKTEWTRDMKTEWERRADIEAEERRMKQIRQADALAEIQRLGQEIDRAAITDPAAPLPDQK